jgi:hypothetical protein
LTKEIVDTFVEEIVLFDEERLEVKWKIVAVSSDY